MKIEKTELKERTFIPYKIEITIESAKEHNDLDAEISRFDRMAPGSSWWGRKYEIPTITALFAHISNHRK
jgi:hypothetical protein